jgi:hypothetical protein
MPVCLVRDFGRLNRRKKKIWCRQCAAKRRYFRCFPLIAQVLFSSCCCRPGRMCAAGAGAHAACCMLSSVGLAGFVLVKRLAGFALAKRLSGSSRLFQPLSACSPCMLRVSVCVSVQVASCRMCSLCMVHARPARNFWVRRTEIVYYQQRSNPKGTFIRMSEAQLLYRACPCMLCAANGSVGKLNIVSRSSQRFVT